MAGSDKKVVWILGAGFSRPLGGPLLNGLISPQMIGDFTNWADFQEEKTPEGYDKIGCAEAVHQIYSLGCAQKNATFWSNPEEFIERVDLARRDTTNLWDFRIRKLYPAKSLAMRQLDPLTALDPMRGLPSPDDLPLLFVNDMQLLHREAVRFVAGACSYFTRDPRDIRNSELWMPYLNWANKLCPQDSILTFNYDNVLDLMNPFLTESTLRWAIPKNKAGELRFEGLSRGATVFQLHGHVGWQRDDEDGGVLRGAPMAFQDPDKAVLGLPGPSKKELSEKHLDQIWNLAFSKLAMADAIVFVGYRFPESDGLARHRILKALRENHQANVHIVLGPRNRDIARVKAMIDWTRTEATSAEVEQMWAEDFFAAFDRDRLSEG